MMWQVVSGSYFIKIDEGIPYSFYLNKSRSYLDIKSTEFRIVEHQGYLEEIRRVCNAFDILTFLLFNLTLYSLGYKSKST